MTQKVLITLAVCLAMICSITVAMKPATQVVETKRSIVLPDLPELASSEAVELVIPEMPEEVLPQPKDYEGVPQPKTNNNCCPAQRNYHYYYHGPCRWDYTPGQPVRNVVRFFHNRQPVRTFFRERQPVRSFFREVQPVRSVFRGIGRLFCWRRC